MMKALKKLDETRTTSKKPRKLLFDLVKEHERILHRYITHKAIPKTVAIEFADDIMKMMDKYIELTKVLIVEDDD